MNCTAGIPSPSEPFRLFQYLYIYIRRQTITCNAVGCNDLQNMRTNSLNRAPENQNSYPVGARHPSLDANSHSQLNGTSCDKREQSATTSSDKACPAHSSTHASHSIAAASHDKRHDLAYHNTLRTLNPKPQTLNPKPLNPKLT